MECNSVGQAVFVNRAPTSTVRLKIPQTPHGCLSTVQLGRKFREGLKENFKEIIG